MVDYIVDKAVDEKPSKEVWLETAGMVVDILTSSKMNTINIIDCFIQISITSLYLQAREDGDNIKELQHGLKSILHDIVDIQLKTLDDPTKLEKALSN